MKTLSFEILPPRHHFWPPQRFYVFEILCFWDFTFLRFYNQNPPDPQSTEGHQNCQIQKFQKRPHTYTHTHIHSFPSIIISMDRSYVVHDCIKMCVINQFLFSINLHLNEWCIDIKKYKTHPLPNDILCYILICSYF